MAEIINAANFEEKVLKNSKPVLVDFFATWCGPCKMMSPVIDEIAAEKAGVVDVFKIDVDENQSIAQKYQVMSIPTLIVFEHGQVKKQTLGAQPKAAVLDLLA
ncbi:MULTISPECIES: thioredoxin [Slackia]|uniref:Thioredoxin n=1 Tax=Slackia exigua (strain ATCC 700122 / DSM 15923 / CIP 105133 / JCM 11022 / KCTC 5966 / S-7) TaxID=649764 RepID=D0WFR7_SLAES|nr:MULTISPECIES: thioredoxin [Slackia]MDU5612407.1 thioredoxin [Slackia sp.]EEZ61330.1 thioredoxin [Slackia exigua ATCC 700122]EJU31450.1 thioredoxin [Slackia sp. CM382]MCK6138877.1 thioredoxin [Slackia exigua]MCQ5090613.1 thioredoxin [Slackia exigua]